MITMDKTIKVSSVVEAIERARAIFERDQACEWVIAEGETTVGGLLFVVNGPLLLHRTELALFLGDDLPAVGKDRIRAILERIEESKGLDDGHERLH